MLTLAVDQSTAVNSVALLDGEAVLWETRWTRAEARGPQLVAVIEAALAGLGRAPAQIEAFAVGVGPGSYSGLRMSISAVRAWALPGGRPVCGVSSAEALARDAMDETGARTAAVAGDARRGRLWLGRFAHSDAADDVAPEGAIALAPLPEAAARITAGDAVVTPDWERIGDALAAGLPPSARLIRESRAPRAATVGRIAMARLRAGRRLDPPTLRAVDGPEPVYLHPPVFVEPRFPPPRPPCGRR